MDTLRTLSQTLFVRLFTQGPGRARNQRGASALEYIVLAGVIVLVVVAGALLLAPDNSSGPIYDTFDSIKNSLTDAAPAED
ncbi:MAG: hypothetical protein COB48_09275 [Pseudoalteromonas sp.]|nr:MAG: hypothetical protein COB48_09275 [Pseudoalteromonas sp.]